MTEVMPVTGPEPEPQIPTDAQPATWSRRAFVGWNAANVLITGASVVVQTWLVCIGSTDVNSGSGTATTPLTTRLTNLFSYFTIQSNILVLIAAVRLLVDPSLSRGRLGWQVVRLTGLLGIFVTGAVYVIVLRPLSHPTGIYAAVNAGLHYITPPLAVVGWLIFGPRPRISRQVFWLALIWPVAWLAYTLIRGAIVGWYPYPFLDVPSIGAGATARNLAVITAMAILVLLIMKAGDRLPTLGTSRRSVQPAGEPR